MISIIIAMRSLWACKILNRDKKTEVRKGLALYNALKRAEERGEEVEFLMYVTKANPRLYGPDIYKCFHAVVGKGPIFKELNGKVVARFKAKAEVIKHKCSRNYDDWCGYYIDRGVKEPIREIELGALSCLYHNQLDNYLKDGQGTALHIRDLEIFDKPKNLADYGLKRSPQSWGYAKKGGLNGES